MITTEIFKQFTVSLDIVKKYSKKKCFYRSLPSLFSDSIIFYDVCLFQDNKFKEMVVCLQMQQISLPVVQIKTFSDLMKLVAIVTQKQQQNIKLFYIDNDQETEIQNQDDLMAIKYIARNPFITFKVYYSKSKEQLQQEIIYDNVKDWHGYTYSKIDKQQLEQQLDNIVTPFLDSMYTNISKEQIKEKNRQERLEIVSEYIMSINQHVIEHQLNRPRKQRKQNGEKKITRLSPIKEISSNRTQQVETIIEHILQEMMPAITKEMTTRVIHELKIQEEEDIIEQDRQMNPEQL